jgi:hypothetical protein
MYEARTSLTRLAAAPHNRGIVPSVARLLVAASGSADCAGGLMDSGGPAAHHNEQDIPAPLPTALRPARGSRNDSYESKERSAVTPVSTVSDVSSLDTTCVVSDVSGFACQRSIRFVPEDDPDQEQATGAADQDSAQHEDGDEAGRDVGDEGTTSLANDTARSLAVTCAEVITRRSSRDGR